VDFENCIPVNEKYLVSLFFGNDSKRTFENINSGKKALVMHNVCHIARGF
jgi:hypothetical protein